MFIGYILAINFLIAFDYFLSPSLKKIPTVSLCLPALSFSRKVILNLLLMKQKIFDRLSQVKNQMIT